jgi:hypothetical protein
LLVRRRIMQPSWVDAAAHKFSFNRGKDEYGRHHCKGCPEDGRGPRRRVPNGDIYLHQLLPILAHIISPHFLDAGRLQALPWN